MKRINMEKQSIKAKIFLFVPALVMVVTIGVFAYGEPTTSPSLGDTSVQPVTLGSTDQVKNGSLSVNAFTARGNALFSQNMTIAGMIRGGNLLSIGPTTVNIGGNDGVNNHTVNSRVWGDAHYEKEIVVASLAHNGSEPRRICGSVSGELVLCPPPSPPAATPVVIAANAYSTIENPSQVSVTCAATLDIPARATDETVDVRVNWYSQMGDQVLNNPGVCQITIPAGLTNGVSTVFTNYTTDYVGSGCVQSSSANIDPSAQC